MHTPLPRVILLSSFFSTDRMLTHTALLHELEKHFMTEGWCNILTEHGDKFDGGIPSWVRKFPEGVELRGYVNVLRHFNDDLWDWAVPSISRHRFFASNREATLGSARRISRLISQPLAKVGFAGCWEPWLERFLIGSVGHVEAEGMLRENKPALLVAMCPFFHRQVAVVAMARGLGIPVCAFITSFDNITTKNRLLFDYDAYFVWSEQMKSELLHFYPRSRKRPIHIVGAPQFDVFQQPDFRQSREVFCRGQGLDPTHPIVVYGLGSPNLIREEHGVEAFLDLLRGPVRRPDIQVVLRLHPGFVNKGYRLLESIQNKHPDVVIQGRAPAWKKIAYQGKAEITEWVNTMLHADVLVNLSSTLAVDAAIFDRPVVNLNFDPEPGQPNQTLVKEINSKWHHFKPIAESGALWMTNSMDETVQAVLKYLEQPELHRAQRAWLVKFVCHAADGRCGERFAQAIVRAISELTPWVGDVAREGAKDGRALQPTS